MIFFTLLLYLLVFMSLLRPIIMDSPSPEYRLRLMLWCWRLSLAVSTLSHAAVWIPPSTSSAVDRSVNSVFKRPELFHIHQGGKLTNSQLVQLLAK